MSASYELAEHLHSIHQDGDTLDSLWKRSDLIVDKLLAASTLNIALRAGMLHKHLGKYYKQPIAVLPSTKPVKAKAPAPVKKGASKKFGTLLPGSEIGNVALAMLIHGKLALPEFVNSCMQRPVVRIGLTLRMLKSAGYVDSIRIKGVDHYSWNNRYDYPFPKFSPSDLLGLILSPSFSIQTLGVARA